MLLKCIKMNLNSIHSNLKHNKLITISINGIEPVFVRIEPK